MVHHPRSNSTLPSRGDAPTLNLQCVSNSRATVIDPPIPNIATDQGPLNEVLNLDLWYAARSVSLGSGDTPHSCTTLESFALLGRFQHHHHLCKKSNFTGYFVSEQTPGGAGVSSGPWKEWYAVGHR